MAALDSLDSLTDADREHLAPFLHAGPTTARSTALQYVKSDPVSKKEPQGRRILVGGCGGRVEPQPSASCSPG